MFNLDVQPWQPVPGLQVGQGLADWSCNLLPCNAKQNPSFLDESPFKNGPLSLICRGVSSFNVHPAFPLQCRGHAILRPTLESQRPKRRLQNRTSQLPKGPTKRLDQQLNGSIRIGQVSPLPLHPPPPVSPPPPPQATPSVPSG